MEFKTIGQPDLAVKRRRKEMDFEIDCRDICQCWECQSTKISVLEKFPIIKIKCDDCGKDLGLFKQLEFRIVRRHLTGKATSRREIAERQVELLNCNRSPSEVEAGIKFSVEELDADNEFLRQQVMREGYKWWEANKPKPRAMERVDDDEADGDEAQS